MRTAYFQCYDCYEMYESQYNLWERPSSTCPCDKKSKNVKRISDESYQFSYRNRPQPKTYQDTEEDE